MCGDIGAGYFRVHLFQRRIVGRGAEKGVGGQQRTGADTADDIEQWPPSALAPAIEEASAEGADLASAGEGKNTQRMPALALKVTKEIVTRDVLYRGVEDERYVR